MRIGELAATTGVSTRTIRYYEELGILPEPKRTSGGTRVYTRDWLFYLEGAKALKDMGFTLEEIRLFGRMMLGMRVSRGEREAGADVVRQKMKSLEHRIRVLTRLHDVLMEIEHDSRGAVSRDALNSLLSAGGAAF